MKHNKRLVMNEKKNEYRSSDKNNEMKLIIRDGVKFATGRQHFFFGLKRWEFRLIEFIFFVLRLERHPVSCDKHQNVLLSLLNTSGVDKKNFRLSTNSTI